MRCNNCGGEIAEGMKFCPSCGNQTSEPLVGAVEMVEVVNGQDETIKDKVESMVSKVDLKKYNIGHLGILISCILTMVSVFLPNPISLDANMYVLLDWANKDGFVFVLILAVLLVFTALMANFNKGIITIIGSIASFCMVVYMLALCQERTSIFEARGLFLFLIGGILLVLSSVAVFKLNKKRKN